MASSLNVPGSASMRFVTTFAAAALLAGVIVPRFAAHLGDVRNEPKITAARAATAVNVASSDPYSVVVPRDAEGHFSVEGRIDGRQLDFMIDTGATVIALTADGAAELGIHPAVSDFTAEVRTANGTVRAAPTLLSLVEVGDIQLHDVAAVVLPEGALGENLLGLSFLSRLRHFDYANGKMVLQQ
jgi:aspartyl protease family protein